MALDPNKVRITEAVGHISAIAVNPVGSKLCWEFYKKHYKVIHGRLVVTNLDIEYKRCPAYTCIIITQFT